MDVIKGRDIKIYFHLSQDFVALQGRQRKALFNKGGYFTTGIFNSR